MLTALYVAIVFTVALMVITAYFLMGGLPLLILKHDVPLDARFIRGFFQIYYRAAFWAAAGACASFALWGRLSFALGMAVIAAVAVLLQRRMLPAMLHLGGQIEGQHNGAIRQFRRVHATALMVNVLQLAVLVWGLIQLSRQLS